MLRFGSFIAASIWLQSKYGFDDFGVDQISGLNNIDMHQMSDFSSYFGVHQISDLTNLESIKFLI